MLNYSQAYYELVNKLQPLYDAQEASAIAHEIMQHITGLDKLRRLMDKDVLFTESQLAQYNTMLVELLKGRPLQYVTGQAWFMSREYAVNENVLIPRPETEELVQWIIDDTTKSADKAILDIGAGSGCIPISLKLALPASKVYSCDISEGALSVAEQNARQLATSIELLHADFLLEDEWHWFEHYDIIVSNPPYITIAEKDSLHTNVRDNEPATALFVTNNDPLQFYKAIAKFGLSHLKPGGTIYCELHRDYAEATKILFEDSGYKQVEIRKDMHGNWRMLKAHL